MCTCWHWRYTTSVKSLFTYSIANVCLSLAQTQTYMTECWAFQSAHDCDTGAGIEATKMLTPRKSFAALKSHSSHISM